jgi:hypothetical protein
MNITQIKAACVKNRLSRSIEMGTKASWSASDHRRMLATVIHTAEPKPTTLEEMIAMLEGIDNHSAFSQSLEKQFLGTGHFMRGAEKKGKELDQLMAELSAQAGE